MGTLKRLLVIGFTLIYWGSANASARLSEAQDLNYGVALYHYHQGDYMQALTELLVAKEKGGIKGHHDNPLVMEGGFYLGYGMQTQAQAVLKSVLSNVNLQTGEAHFTKNKLDKQAQARRKQVREAAWYYLGKLYYQEKDWDAALAVLGQLSDPDSEYYQDALAYQIQIAIMRGELTQARSLLANIAPHSQWRMLILLNIGAAYARNQDYSAAIEVLSLIDQVDRAQERFPVLFDRAAIALAYAYFFRGDFVSASTQFSRVSLDGPFSGDGLLGYGWVQFNLAQYERAIDAWSHLTAHTIQDNNSLEAFVALPFVFEKMGEPGVAVQYLERAEQIYTQELARIDDAVTDAKTGQIVQRFVRHSDDDLNYVDSRTVAPENRHLIRTFSKEPTQQIVRWMNDVQVLKRKALEWQSKLHFYGQSLIEREQFRRETLLALQEDVSSSIGLETIDKLKRQYVEDKQAVSFIKRNLRYADLLDGEEKDLWQRVERLQKNVALLKDSDPFIDEYQESLRRFRGLLLWQAAEQFSGRLWQLEKSLHIAKSQIKLAEVKRREVILSLQKSPDLDREKLKVELGKQRIDGQLTLIDSVSANLEKALVERIIRDLQTDKAQVKGYLAQAKFAKARLLDQINDHIWHPENRSDQVKTPRESAL